MSWRTEAIAFLKINGDDWRRELKSAEQEAKRFSAAVGDAMKKAALAAVALTTGISIIGANFEYQMAKVGGVSKATAQEMQALETAARAMGAATAYSATQAAEGQEQLLRAGLGVKGALESLEGVLKLAGAGVVDMGVSADLTAAALKIWKTDTADTARVVNALYAATTESKLSVDTLSTALANGGPIAAAYNIPLEESLAVLGKLTDILQDAGRAGTYMKTTVSELTRAQRENAGEIGAALQGWNIGTEGIVGAVQRLERAGITSAGALAELGEKAGPGLSILLQTGSNALRTMQASVTGTNAAFDAYARQMDTTKGRFEELKSAGEEMALRIFDAIKGPLNDALVALTALVSANFDEVSAAAREIVDVVLQVGGVLGDVAGFVARHKETFIGLAAGIMTAKVAIGAAAIATAAWNAILAANPVGIIIISLAAAGAAIGFLIEKMGGWGVVSAYVMGGIRIAWEWLIASLKTAWAEIKFGGQVFVSLGETVKEALRLAWEYIKAFGASAWEIFQLIGEGMLKPWKQGEISGQIADVLTRTVDEMAAIAESGKLGEIWSGLTDGLREEKLQIQIEWTEALRRIQAETAAAVAAARASAAGGVGGGGGGAASEGVSELQAMMEQYSTIRAETETYVRDLEGETHELRMMRLDEDVAAERRRAQAVADAHEWVNQRVAASASAAWSYMTREAAKATSLQAAMKLKLGAIMIGAARAAAAAEIEAQGQVAAQRALFEAAMALGALARFDFRGAALHGAAAAKFGLLAAGAAIGAAVVRGGSEVAGAQGGLGYSDEGATSAGAGVSSSGRGSVSIGQRSAPEVVNIYVQTSIGGNVLGDFGDVVDQYVVPRLRELLEGGVLAPAR